MFLMRIMSPKVPFMSEKKVWKKILEKIGFSDCLKQTYFLEYRKFIFGHLENFEKISKKKIDKKCSEKSNELVVKMRVKKDRSGRDNSVRKSHYFAPKAKLFGGQLVDYVRESGQAIPRIVSSCVRTINLHGFCHQGIFRVPGNYIHPLSFFACFF